ncbi:hypothetical protein [Pedobacter sp. NJ-S-72]
MQVIYTSWPFNARNALVFASRGFLDKVVAFPFFQYLTVWKRDASVSWMPATCTSCPETTMKSLLNFHYQYLID